MVRRFLLALFVLTHLAGPVGAAYAFACEMMDEAPVLMKKCCCDPDDAKELPCNADGEVDGDCCETLIVVTDTTKDASAQIGASPKPPKPPPQAFSFARPLHLGLDLSALPASPTRDNPASLGFGGTDLYLQTLRLRL